MSRLFLSVVLVLSAIVGCGVGKPKLYPVSGQVKYNDKPVPTGWVLFLSEEGKTVTATIESDGRYQAQLPAGTHRVGVSAPREITTTGFDAFKEGPLPPHVPIKFADPEYTGIVFTVKGEGENVFDITLKSGRRRGGG